MRKKVFLVFSVSAVLVMLNLPFVRVLSISNRKNRSERIYSRAAFEQGFAISYTHSVNKGRVHDFYRAAQNGGLELFMTEFVSYGAGIPEASETEGAHFRVTQNGYVIEDLNRVLPRLLMVVGVVAEHSVTITNEPSPLETDFGTEFFLKDFFKPQTSLVFEAKRVSLVNYFMTKRI